MICQTCQDKDIVHQYLESQDEDVDENDDVMAQSELMPSEIVRLADAPNSITCYQLEGQRCLQLQFWSR